MEELEDAMEDASIATLKSVIIESQVGIQALNKRLTELETLAYDAALMSFGSLYRAEKWCIENGIPLKKEN